MHDDFGGLDGGLDGEWVHDDLGGLDGGLDGL